VAKAGEVEDREGKTEQDAQVEENPVEEVQHGHYFLEESLAVGCFPEEELFAWYAVLMEMSSAAHAADDHAPSGFAGCAQEYVEI